MYLKSIPFNAPAGFAVREATSNDVDALTRLWYQSFYTSHGFWQAVTPDDPVTRQWLNDAWDLGVQCGPSVFKTWVVEDLAKNGKIVAFARWHVPQADGKQDFPLPTYPAHWDAELTDALWGGMPRNRLDVMGTRPHWMFEFLGVDKGYQGKGLGYRLMEWGCKQADATGLEVYLDATIQGRPLYNKWFGFQDRKILEFPLRPDGFKEYYMMAMVRPAVLKAAADRYPTSEAVTDSNGFVWESESARQ
ncbi:hypothetical protein TWF281_002032 [Arthrobotrys megalospora]